MVYHKRYSKLKKGLQDERLYDRIHTEKKKRGR